MLPFHKNKLSFRERWKGVLGINARNLLYISRFNSKANKSFADDKIFTKNYLQSRGLGTAKVYAVIKNYDELNSFNPRSLPNNFVIKPNRGYGGEGIIVFTDKKGNKFIDIEGEEHDWEDIYRHLSAILDGKYAISGLYDQAIIEERLLPHDYFKLYLDKGLPDIRIIVFNYVPVIAMLRLPTAESRGKANLHLGAVGIGIDIANGRATFAVHHNKFIRKLPNGESLKELKIPDWEQILLTASQAQKISQIGFLAVDISLTTSGIKILELNARAGLSVQIANQIPLKARLKKVADLNVSGPEKGLEICKTIFGKTNLEKNEKKERPTIGLFELAEILSPERQQIWIKIDPHFNEAIFDKKLKKNIGELDFLDLKLKNQRLVIPAKYENLTGERYQAIIGKKYLSNFLIDLEPQQALPIKHNNKKDTIELGEKIIKNLDKKIAEIDNSLHLLGFLRPQNYNEVKEEFFRQPQISPHFFYPSPSIDTERWNREIKSLPKEIDHPLSPLYRRKLEELQNKIKLVEAIDTENFQKISEKLYGTIDRKLYDQAVHFLINNPIEEDNSEILNHKQVVKKLNEFLENQKLNNWKIKDVSGRVSDISVGKNGFIFLREDISFSANRLRAIIAHEIATHIFRYENGRLQKYKIFENGTANYLKTEEGLAIYNQIQLNIPLGEKKHWPAWRVIAAYLGQEMGFAELFHYLKKQYRLDDEQAWRACVRAKRGLSDTDKKLVSTRDIIYFQGLLEVEEYLKNHPENGLHNLYIGKIHITNLKKMGDLKNYKVRFLPDYNLIREF